ncbi:MAG TPA: ABC transporter permease [Solirubrobacteraceae bacterium]|nr:ABC transporter permease [Solirubrobacteraceae bacterium]
MSVRASAALPSAGVTRRQIGIAGCVLGAIAWVITIPPIEVRTLVPSIVLAALAVCAGAWSAAGGERKLGIEAIVVALLAVAGAEASVHSALGTLESVFTWSALVAATLRYMTPLLFAALGGVVSESSGVINIGLEGMMLMGCFWGIYGADLLHSWVWGLLVAMLSGAVLGAIHAFFSIHLRADQIVSGFGIIFLALGITGYFLEYHYGPNGTPLNISMIPNVKLPIQHVGFFGTAIGDANLMTWIGLALVPALTFFLFRTRWGLRLRSVGEKPRAADTLGLPVLRIRYAAVIASGVLAALGGAYLSVGFVGSFSNDMTNGRGFIALAAMIFGKWKPWGALWATLLFGFGSAMADRVSSVNSTLGTLFEALPYVVTLIAVAGLVGRSRAPAADGIPYVRE